MMYRKFEHEHAETTVGKAKGDKAEARLKALDRWASEERGRVGQAWVWWAWMVTGSITGMATANVTVSLDAAVIDMAKQQAAASGMSMSAWVARTIRTATFVESARRYAEFDADDTDMGAWDAERASTDRLAGAEW
jgi:hypothetical protein